MTMTMTPHDTGTAQRRRGGGSRVLRRLAASALALGAIAAAGGGADKFGPARVRDLLGLGSVGAVDPQLRRRASEALPNGGCFVTPSVAAPPNIKPVFAASYPGSGARMTWNLIEALTGIVTGSDWNSNGWGKRVVSVKTHYPHPHGKKLDWEDEIDRAFVVVRNPVKAIPSFHNFLFEFQYQLENHSLRAPVEEWIRWRDGPQGFSAEVAQWRKHIEYYMDRYPLDKRLVVSYEDMTSEPTGPRVSREMVRFFAKGPGVDPIPEESAECVWGTVVNYQSGKKYNTRKPLDKSVRYVGSYPIWPGSKRKGDKERPLTRRQIDEVVQMLQEVKIKARDMGDEKVRHLMQRYIDEVREVPADPRTAADLPPPTGEPPEIVRQALREQRELKGDRPGGPVPTAKETMATKGGQPKAWTSGGTIQAAG